MAFVFIIPQRSANQQGKGACRTALQPRRLSANIPAVPYISLLRQVCGACIMKYTYSLHIRTAGICLDSLGMDIYNCS